MQAFLRGRRHACEQPTRKFELPAAGSKPTVLPSRAPQARLRLYSTPEAPPAMRAFVLAVLLALAAARGAAAQENADSVMEVLSSSPQLSTLNKYVQKVGAGAGGVLHCAGKPQLVGRSQHAGRCATLSGDAGDVPPSCLDAVPPLAACRQ